MWKKLKFGKSMSGKSRPPLNLPKDVRIIDPHEDTMEEIARILLRKRSDEPEHQPKLGKRIESLLMSWLMQNAKKPPPQ